MPKFTQGEWKCHNNEFNEIRISAAIYRYEICTLPDYSFLSSTPQKDKEEQKANARLIAAAPEMYRRLKFVLEFFEDLDKANIFRLRPNLYEDFLSEFSRVDKLLAKIDREEDNAES